MFRLGSLVAALVLSMLVTPLRAQNREVPYWASIRAEKVNMRVGPSADYRVDWVYKRKGLPVKVVRVMEGWRLIQDPDGTQGWVVARLLSPERGAIVIGEGPAAMRDGPNASAKIKWKASPGVVGGLGKCQQGWCEFNAGGREGWIEMARLWGSGQP